jgi:acyl-CoA synthetase (AMP-forming)/AMP-acid ligase II
MMKAKYFLLAVVAAGLLTACNEGKKSGGTVAEDLVTEDSVAQSEVVPEAAPEYDLEALARRIDGAETVMGFSEGRASVENADEKVGVIDKMGNVVIPFEYGYSVFRYSDGVICCVKRQDDVWCYFDREGKLLFSSKDGGPSQFHDGFACKYSSETGKYYFIDKKGEKAFGGKMWEWAQDFSDGMASVFDGRGWGFINTEGELVIPCEYESAAEQNPGGFSEGLAAVVIVPERELFGYIDKTGKQVFPNLYFADTEFSEGLAWVFDRESQRYGYIDKTGKLVIKLEQNWNGDSFSEGLALVRMGGKKLGFIDKTGKLVIDLGEEYDEAFPFQEGRARVRKDRSYGFIDTEGKLVIPCEYASCYENFSEGLVPAKKGEKWGYIARDGKSTFDF